MSPYLLELDAFPCLMLSEHETSINSASLMNIDQLQDLCRGLPGTTEDLKWGANLVFSVASKMYTLISLDEEPPHISFKTEPAMFEALTHQEGIIPAPYLAKASWVTLDHVGVLPEEELEHLVGESYRLVFERLTKKAQREIRGDV